MNKVLVIATHPDDETLGCGGTLLKHKAQGDEIYWCIVTSAEEYGDIFLSKREQEITKVIELYEFDSVYELDIPTTKVDTIELSKLTDMFTKVINDIKPDIVYLPFRGDVHSDHRIVFDIAFSTLKQFRAPSVKTIYMMEVLSETEFSVIDTFIPNVFIDISEFIDKKIDIMKIYDSELKEHPFPRSIKNIKALATYRGATSGCEYAESFMLLKDIQ